MILHELLVLLPCYSLEDLSLDRNEREADELLAAWSGLFHPALIAAAASIPKWGRADSPPQEPNGRLIAIPPVSQDRVPSDWIEGFDTSAGSLIRGFRTREEVVFAALSHLDQPPPEVDGDLLGDFFALGFCHLQVELLTRQLRYMSNLDEVQFQRKTVAAAGHALEGEIEPARENLRAAFDLLSDAREYFYPVEAHLLDLTLVATTTMGEALRRELACGPTNLLISGATLEALAEQEPETHSALQAALEEGRAALIGGDYDEQEWPLLPLEAVLNCLRHGLAVYDRLLGRRPAIFGRRRFGLIAALPQILRKLGFTGGLHCTLDDGQFPTSNQSKIRWEGPDATVLESLIRLPFDAAESAIFLRLPEKLGGTLDLDHAATAIFAHWPGKSSPWYGDLRRMSRNSPVLGRFRLIREYFRDTEYVGRTVAHKADQYRSPYLRQAVAAGQDDPISRWTRYYRLRAAAESLQSLATLVDLIAGTSQASDHARTLMDEIDRSPAEPASGLAERVRHRLDQTIAQLASRLGMQPAGNEPGCLIFNAHSFAQRQLIDLPAPVQTGAASAESKPRQALIEVPGMGFSWVGTDAEGLLPLQPVAAKKRFWRKQEEPPMIEENLLRNDFFEATIDPATGSLRSLHDYRTRGNRLAQQIALRIPQPNRSKHDVFGDDEETDYSVMAADRIEATQLGLYTAQIATYGRLVDRQGQCLAGFVQRYTARRGSRILEIEIELDAESSAGADPWDSYYAARFAWGNPDAELYRGTHLMTQLTEINQIEAPHFIEIRTPHARTAILTAGLPYHRRRGERKLDSLLVVRGETAQWFRIGVGIDIAYPAQAALAFLAPATQTLADRPSSVSGWLFHVDAKNVLATHWEPMVKEDRITGFRVRLLETEGRRGELSLRSFRPLSAARKTDYESRSLIELAVRSDTVTMNIGPHEWAQIECDMVQ